MINKARFFMRKDLHDKVKKFPASAGVYIMRSKKGNVLYVGKASFLKKRVSSYFLPDKSYKNSRLMEKVSDIEYIECNSPAQALILEAALIREKKPKYNVLLKDDKSYPYVEITRDIFPRVVISRPKDKAGRELFGPFTKIKLLKPALNMIRKIFPYCSCRAGQGKKKCLFAHLGLCPAPCAGEITVEEYKENIESIRKILKGERKELFLGMEKKMAYLVKNQKFEAAALIRDKLIALRSLYWGKADAHQLLSLRERLNLPVLPLTIEAIDISCLKGESPAGSVVVFQDGEPDKSNYRRYRIKEVEKIDDYAMIGEVLRRRYHRLILEKKRLPDLIIIDGGKGHVQTAKEGLTMMGLSIPVIGIAKRNEEIWFPFKKDPLVLSKREESLRLIQRIRDEAHRFAHAYHLVRRKKKLITDH